MLNLEDEHGGEARQKNRHINRERVMIPGADGDGRHHAVQKIQELRRELEVNMVAQRGPRHAGKSPDSGNLLDR